MTWQDLSPDDAAAAVVKARAQLMGLQRKRDGADQRMVDLASERSEIGFAVHGAGDRAARKRLDEIHKSITEHASEIQSIDAAVLEARRLVTAAEEEARRAADRQRALQARALLAELRAAGSVAQAALELFVSEFQKVQGLANQMGRMDCGAPGPNLVRINAKRAAWTGLYPADLGQLLPPAERIELADLIEKWATGIEAGIARLLVVEPAPAAEAA